MIRLVLIFGAISIIGIIIIQVYWVRKAFDLKEKQFNQTVTIALKNAAERIAGFNHSALAVDDPVTQVSSGYYVVNVNSQIDAAVLEHYLKAEFSSFNIHQDYEYAIYDCATNRMIYGNYISSSGKDEAASRNVNLPKYNKYTYYFGIYFPNRPGVLAGKMDIWVFSSAILLLVIGFFAYTMYVILKQNRLSEIQKDFVNNMTHEFKTPLSTISVSTSVLSNPDILQQPEKLSTYTNIIKEESHKLVTQVEKVLQMATLERSSIELKPEIVNLEEVLKDIIERVKMNVRKPLQIALDIQTEKHSVQADRMHLSNVIYNLLDNAIKYSAAEACIHISLVNKEQKLVLSIADKGIGLGQKDIKKVFDKFYRVPTGNRHDVKGFGLGLYYVKNIVDAHKWKIDLQSTAGSGTTFTISISVNNG
jgi:two-component system phosphate regulon sensor histidine kinase PhoR